MSEQKSEKIFVSRNVAIALGIFCIILAVGLVGAIANYTAMINNENSTTANLQQQITTLNQKVENLTTTLNQTVENAPANLSVYVPLAPIQQYVSSNTYLTFRGAFIVNFGAQSASNVQITFTITINGYPYVQPSYSVGTVSGHSIYELADITYSFPYQVNSYSWTYSLTWAGHPLSAYLTP